MAVFSWYSGDPFSFDMDEKPFHDAVSNIQDLSADAFVFAADSRLRMQTVAWSALSYRTYDARRWITHGDTDPSAEDWLTLGSVVVISASLNIAPYLNPYTAPIAFALDVFNIYRYFD